MRASSLAAATSNTGLSDPVDISRGMLALRQRTDVDRITIEAVG